ncbi:phosphoribosylglycinamide formyltransferase [Candidatus Peregrinibacteria bacterium CG10_big_fil_rev_8_21_14_0_10_49_24]|nr:MAG: phosphoribosylglycinamide formyltransferase [Candidatus Peregrinibacteria bacterium CG11_big_fil_rev_8_21_14_0_20_49_14]PIR50814.1 MAG: phosphoribosylglycinamide formyltransferase [Candidatus Peregrinibacteria bacterium CG10_big_fil_rev_8_21_14_0_10_49_24]PJA67290.1 MAG: phosphoribosylglycinamide formyltransferase [Candidatus Peregrinibacteria bacterium CG_4_9_14_3_um_filter_49_12]
MQFVVLSSSRGTTFQSVLDNMANGTLSASCMGLVSDSEDRGCIEKAKDAGVPVRIVSRMPNEDREQYDRRLHETILELFGNNEDEPRILAALGWMYIFTPWFIAQWKNRIINVHPALLPKYGGRGMYGMKVHEAVLQNEESESGISIHLMDEGVDTGLILEQKSCSVLPDDTPDSLKEKVQGLEKEYYPALLQKIQTGNIVLPS